MVMIANVILISYIQVYDYKAMSDMTSGPFNTE